ncbi:MAG: TRIC cation channel family protein [Pseudomonadales bacterium]
MVTFFVVRFMTRLSDVLLWFDAPGLSVFCAIGAAKAMAVTGDPIIGVVMGVITAVAGGILRALLLLTSRLCSAWQRPLLFEALA